jgi:hypothetical protein
MRPTRSAFRLLSRQRPPCGLRAPTIPFRQSIRLDSTAKDPSSSTSTGLSGPEKKKGGYTSILATLVVSGIITYGVQTWRRNQAEGSGIARPGEFVKYTLAAKEDVSSTCAIFTLRPAGNKIVDVEGLLDERAITSVQFKQPQLQIARNYTLLPPLHDQDPLDLRFLIRKERNGEVSNYLHRLPLGAEVELRGPSVEYVFPEQVKTVVFLAGGTGIAPALQVADKLAGDADVHILWASRKREDSQGGVSDSVSATKDSKWTLFGWWKPSPELAHTRPHAGEVPNILVAQLEGVKKHATARQPGHCGLKINYYVDEEGTFVQTEEVKRLITSLSTPGAEQSTGAQIIVVSGPDGFINYWAGPKQWVDGREVQGPLSGALSKLKLPEWKVVKL